MKNLLLFFLLFPCIAWGANEVTYLKSLEKQASDYRILAITCVIHAKLEKKPLSDIDICGELYEFTTNDYPALKQSLITAEKNAKEEGEAKGLKDPLLREKLVAIMSAKSHMNIAGSILSKID